MTFMRKIINAFKIGSSETNTKTILETQSISEQDRLNFIASGRPFKFHFDNSRQIIPEELYSCYNGTLPKRKEEKLATDILCSVGMFTHPSFDMCVEAKKYLSGKHSRIEICVYGAQICIPPQNNNELYIISKAYHWAGAAYRKEAIYWLEKYIENGAVSDYIQRHIIYSQNYSYDQRIKFVSIAHSTLAELYAEEKMYDASNNEYIISITIAPFISTNYIKLASNYIKQKHFSNVDQIMQNAKTSIFYEIDSTFKENIDRHIIQFEQEIKEINYYTDIVIPGILQAISRKPGILQKELYNMYPHLDPQHIRWICKHLDQDNKLYRNKKGNSYALFIDNSFE